MSSEYIDTDQEKSKESSTPKCDKRYRLSFYNMSYSVT